MAAAGGVGKNDVTVLVEAVEWWEMSFAATVEGAGAVGAEAVLMEVVGHDY